MKKIFVIFIIFFISCIIDEKTNCYIDKRREVNNSVPLFNNCEASIVAFGRRAISENNQQNRDIIIVSCLLDYSVYQSCKNKSQIKPVSGTANGYE